MHLLAPVHVSHRNGYLSQRIRAAVNIRAIGHAPANGRHHLSPSLVGVVGVILRWNANHSQIRIAGNVQRTGQFHQRQVIKGVFARSFRLVLRVVDKTVNAHYHFSDFLSLFVNVVDGCVNFDVM